MTLESWSNGVVRPMTVLMPNLWPFFIIFIAVTTFALVNLVTGVFLDQVLAAANEDHQTELDRRSRWREDRLKALREIFADADTDRSGELNESEFSMLLKRKEVLELFEVIGFELVDLNGLFHLLDVGEEGLVDIDEFCSGMLKLQRDMKVSDMLKIER